MLKFFGSQNEMEAKSEDSTPPESSLHSALPKEGVSSTEVPSVPSIQGERTKTPEKVLRDILAGMGMEGTVSVQEGGEGEILLTIEGEDGALLIGKKGQTLDALEYLLNRICSRNQRTGKKILVDTENYRNKREEKLISLAQRLAEKVEKSGMPEMVDPLNPMERKIVHTALRDHVAVDTQSEGEGFLKKIIISLKKNI